MRATSRRGPFGFRWLVFCASLLLAASMAVAAGDTPPIKDTKPSPDTKTSCTADEKRHCDEVTKNFEGKPCGSIDYKVVGGICQCECRDQPGGTAPKKRRL